MADATWPLELPTWVLQDDYDLAPGEGAFSASKTDLGPPIVRYRSAATPWPETATIVVDYDQFIAFKDWYRNTLKHGTLTFQYGVPGAPTGAAYLGTDEGAPIGTDEGLVIGLDYDWLYVATYRFATDGKPWQLRAKEMPWYLLTMNLLRLTDVTVLA
jgi:hypothetical protein